MSLPSSGGMHSRWWSKLFSSGLCSINRPGKDSASTYALS